MQIVSSCVMLTKDLDMSGRALFCKSLTLDTITGVGGSYLHLIGNVDFRDTSDNVAISVQPVVGVAILNTLNMYTNNSTHIGSITCNTIACTGTSGTT